MPPRCAQCHAQLAPDHHGPCPRCGAASPTSTALQVLHADSTLELEPVTAADAPRRDDLVGTRIAGCHIREIIGQGGMGRVYRAVHQGLGKTLAVKVLNAQLVANTTFVERFLREARSAAQLDHPNVVRILNAGEEQGRYFIVMEFVDGENLRARLRRESRLDRGEALRITVSVAHALAAAHELGIVHRDVKPDNIMLATDGVVKVADFGLARQAAATGEITAEGLACGTPPYMSPEQISGLAVDGRSDLYGLGITLYECLAGKRPFTAESLVGWLECHTRREPEPLRRHVADLPDEIAEVVARLLAKRPEDRYGDARELLADLQFIAGDEPQSSPRESTRRNSRHDLAPTGTKRLHTLLGQGIDEGAVSMHIEPVAGGGRVRMRVRGELKEIERLSAGALRQLIDACRAATGHTAVEDASPVEGAVEFEHDHQRRQAKLSIAPTQQGPRAALRLMGLVQPHNTLIQQGFGASHVKQWRDWLVDAPGLVAIAGPAGSGKGQTVGGVLGLLDLARMLTVAVAEETQVDSEDISQLQIDHRTSRQDALRLALRQYPDLVLLLDVDGLGDRGTAHDTIQAAASGRRILASLVWEDAADSIANLLLLGIDARLLARALRGVVSPRLVRLTCPACREVYTPDETVLGRLHISAGDGPFWRSRGCPRCQEAGKRRRTVVYESFAPTPAFWEELGEERSEAGVAQVVARHGVVSMREMLLSRVKKGFIDPEHAAAILPASY